VECPSASEAEDRRFDSGHLDFISGWASAQWWLIITAGQVRLLGPGLGVTDDCVPYSRVAQPVERLTVNEKVGGSIPSLGADMGRSASGMPAASPAA
jgi:hypothetical protein